MCIPFFNRLEDIAMSLCGKVLINEQEDTGDYDFSISEKYMTTGFQNTFGKEAVQIAFTAVSLIMVKHQTSGSSTIRNITPYYCQKNTKEDTLCGLIFMMQGSQMMPEPS